MTDPTLSRPPVYSRELDNVVVSKLLPKVISWLKNAGDTDIDEEEVREQLREAAFMADDGYKFARELERSGWESDSELVDILDNAFFERIRAHKLAVQAWVTQHSISPKFSVGQRVTFKCHRHDKEAVTGEITKVMTDEATYVVFCESLGHVRRVDKGTGTTGIYVPYENVIEDNTSENNAAAVVQ